MRESTQIALSIRNVYNPLTMANNIEGNHSQSDISKESPKNNSVFLTFYGWEHVPVNVQGVKDIRIALTNHLAQHQGRTIVFIEMADYSREDATESKRLVEEVGYVGMLLHNRLREQLGGKNPPRGKIKKRIKESKQMSGVEAVEKDFIGVQFLQDFEIFKMLDELRRKNKFTPEFEEHSQEVLDRGKELAQIEEQYSQYADISWTNKNWPQFIGALRSSWEYHSESALGTRDAENLSNLQRKLQLLTQHKKGGSLFVLFGGAHKKLAQSLHETKTSGRPFSSTMINLEIEDEFFHPIDELTRYGKISDETLARTYFLDVVNQNIIDSSIRLQNASRVITSYTQNYLFIVSAMKEIISTFSTDEIRGICEDDGDLFSAFLSRPLPPILNSYIQQSTHTPEAN